MNEHQQLVNGVPFYLHKVGYYLAHIKRIPSTDRQRFASLSEALQTAA